MNNKNKKQNQQILQQGSTLFICLMLLLAISIISLAAMRTSLLELVIANNKQQFSNTFQASEQIINSRLGNLTIEFTGTETTDQVLTTENATDDVNVTIGGATMKTATVDSKIIYRTKTAAAGWELGSGLAYHFQIEAKANSPAQTATSEQRVGFYIVAPTSD